MACGGITNPEPDALAEGDAAAVDAAVAEAPADEPVLAEPVPVGTVTVLAAAVADASSLLAAVAAPPSPRCVGHLHLAVGRS